MDFLFSPHALIFQILSSTPCGNNLVENPPRLDVIANPHPSTLTPPPSIHRAKSIKRCLSELVEEDFSGCTDLNPIRHLWVNWMPTESRDLSPLCSSCGYKEENPRSHCTLSFFFFSLSFICKDTKDEVTKLEWLIHWEFMSYGNCFHFSNCFKFVLFVSHK